MVRVRGLHLDESNVTVDGTPIGGGLFDLTCCALAARDFLSRGKTPKFYVQNASITWKRVGGIDFF